MWSTKTLKPLFVLRPYLEDQAGDLFSLVWLPSTQTIFIGCQNTSLQWFSFTSDAMLAECSTSVDSAASSSSGTSTPSTLVNTPRPDGSRQAHKFFDSYPIYERRPADLLARNRTPRPGGKGSPDSQYSYEPSPALHFSIPAANVIDPAHYGYIYCMTLLTGTGDGITRLATGSGDETVKVCFEKVSSPRFASTHQSVRSGTLATKQRLWRMNLSVIMGPFWPL